MYKTQTKKAAFTEKSWLLAISLPLLCLAQARGQTVDGTQIIGYLDASDPTYMTSQVNSGYTTFIDGFIEPMYSSAATGPLQFDSMGFNGNATSTADASLLSPAYVSAVNQVEAAGKNVLLSFGGSAVSDDQYNQYASNPAGLATLLAAYVNGTNYTNPTTNVSTPTYAGTTKFNGFSGIDLDFEDTAAFQTGAYAGKFNGVTFLQALTTDLAADLPGKIITQAPQTIYLDNAYTQGNTGQYGVATGAYQAVLTNNYTAKNPAATLTAAGRATTWLNVQFYNNPSDDGSTNADKVAGVVQAFEKLVTDNPGIPVNKIVLTLPLNAANAGDNNTFNNGDISTIVQDINSYLKGMGDGSIAGVAGFQLYNPNATSMSDQEGVDSLFASDLAADLGVVPEPSTYAFVAVGVLGLAWQMRRRKALNA